MISTNSIEEAAKQCKISKTTIYTRLKDAEFEAKYRDLCRGMVKDCASSLQFTMSKAVSAMSKILDDENASDQVRLNTADAILRHGLKFTEKVDILERLDDLARMIEEGKR